MLDGEASTGVTLGGELSITVTRCTAVALLPCTSNADQVTVVIPSGKVAGALLLTDAIAQLSEATALPRTTGVAEQDGPAGTVTSGGGVMDGGVLSVTTTCCVADAL